MAKKEDRRMPIFVFDSLLHSIDFYVSRIIYQDIVYKWYNSFVLMIVIATSNLLMHLHSQLVNYATFQFGFY